MEIRDVEVLNLRFDYEPGAGYETQRGLATGGLASFVRIVTSDDVEGIGPAYTHPDLLRVIVEGQFRPLLIGRNPLEIEETWQRLYGVTRWYGRKGVALSAVGAIDVALWDIRGKVEDRRVSELLGSDRSRVDAYASGLLWKADPADLTAEAAELRKSGFRRVKTRTGINLEYDRAVVEAVRAGVGDDGDVLVDGAMRYPLDLAIEFGHFLTDAEAFWFEEPFPPEAIEDYAALRNEVGVRIAAGENEFGLEGFAELFRADAVDIAQPDVSRAGGISECVRIARLADEHGVLLAPHTWSDAVTVVANAHVAAAAPNALTVEVNKVGNRFIDELLERPLVIADGQLELPDGPGLGLTLSAEALERYLVPANEVVKEGHYSDMTFGQHWDRWWDPYPLERLPDFDASSKG